MRLPEWIKTNTRVEDLHETKSLLRRHGLSTVCEEARCPNKAECFTKPTAAFMILGDACTRMCGFCSVGKGVLSPPDPEEPLNVALASKEMSLRYVVLTSPTRDDLPDGGAMQFAKTILEIRRHLPLAKVEVLTPDFQGSADALDIVIEAGPDVFNHNMETVPRLYSTVRPKADYARSLQVLARAKRLGLPSMRTKSGLMLGLGETFDEVLSLMRDLRDAETDFLTVGQYLRPNRQSLPVVEYVRPEVFERIKEEAYKLGFKYAASSPLARSSMNAEEVYDNVNS